MEALGHYVSVCPVDELRLQAGTRRAVLGRLVPELAGTRDPTSSRGDDPEADRFALFDAVASLLREVAHARSLVLVLDDVHWADPSSLLLLRHLARSADGAPLLILATYRDTEVHEGDPLAAALAELRRARLLDPVSLAGLEADEVATLIRVRGAEVEEQLARAVAERSEGNPFYVEEIVRQLGEDGELAVPESVKDLILRRLRELDEPQRRTLAAAAVIGREFELDILERVTGSDADELLDLVERAAAERVLVELPEAIGRYAFAHTLIRATIYEQLSSTRRARLHLRVGEALAGADRLDEEAATLARHFTLGGDDARSFEHQLHAARAAAQVYALEAALAHYDAARESGARLGLSPETDESMRQLPLERGWVRQMIGDGEAAVADYGTALELARTAGDRHMEAKALDQLAYAEKGFDVERSIAYQGQALRIAEDLADAPAQVSILNRLSLAHSNQLDLGRAVEVGERALALAGETGDERDRVRALDALKLAALQLGELDRLEELTSELDQIERRHGDLWYLQWTLFESAFVPIGRASWDQATARLDEALTVSRRIGDSTARVLIHDAIGWLARSRGRYAEAIASGREAIAGSDRGDRLSPWRAWTRATLGWTLLEVRAIDEALAVLERGLAEAQARGDRLRSAGHLSWARALAGDREGSERAAAEAEEALAGVGVPSAGAFVFGFGALSALARAHLAAGNAERADAVIAPLLTAAERTGWREATGSALVVSGLVRIALGEEGEAREQLVRAAELARDHELPGVEWEALAEHARLQTGSEAGRLRAESAAIVRRLAAELGDEGLAAGLLRVADG